jgi:hypothetical protein
MNNVCQQSQKDTQGAVLLQAKWDCSDQVHSNQMVLGTVRRWTSREQAKGTQN